MAQEKDFWRLQWWTMLITLFVFVVIMQLGRCDKVEESYNLPLKSIYGSESISTPIQTSLNITETEETQVATLNQVNDYDTTEDELMDKTNNKSHNNTLIEENVMSTTSETPSISTAAPTKKPEDKSNATDDNKTDDKNSSSGSSTSTSTSSKTSITITTTKSVAPTTSTSSSTTSSTTTSSSSSSSTTSEPTSDTASNETSSNEPECSTKTTHGTFSATFVCAAFLFGVCCGIAVSRLCRDSKCFTSKCCDKMSTILHKWYYLLRYRGSIPAYSRAINIAVEQDDISHGDELYDVAEKENTHMTHSRSRHWHDVSPSSSSAAAAAAAALTTDKQSKVSELLSSVPQSVMAEKRKNAVALHKRVELDVPTWTQSTLPAQSESQPPAITTRPASLLTSRKNAALTSDNVEMLPLTTDQYSQQRQEQSALGYTGPTTLNAMDDW